MKQPQVGEYYRNKVFHTFTCQVNSISNGLITIELVHSEKTPFKWPEPPVKVVAIESFDEFWEPYDQ